MLPIIFYLSVISAGITFFVCLLLHLFKNPKDDIPKYFMIYIYLATTFDMAGVIIWLKGMEGNFFHQHAWAGIETFFFNFILWLIYSRDKNEKASALIISTAMALMCYAIDFQNNWSLLDTKAMSFEMGTVLISGCAALVSLVPDFHKLTTKEFIKQFPKSIWNNRGKPELYIITGVLIYESLNLLSYPKNHLLSNILMQMFFTASLILMWKTNEVLLEGQRSNNA